MVAVDAGTTEIKTVGYDEAGAETTIVRRSTRVRSPRPGLAEQDLTEVWQAVAGTIHEATGGRADVELIAVTGQGDGCWLVDRDGRPAGPAVLWNDGRAAPTVERWQRDGRLEQAFRINGSVGFAGSPHAILDWLVTHEPDRVATAAAALTCDGWLFRCLTGEIAVDESDAAAPWLDLTRRDYSAEILELFGLPWAHRLLPPLRRDHQRVAGLSRTAAAELGLPADVPVVMAPYDVAATSIGAGAVADRQACAILGTTLSTQLVMSTPDLTGPVTGLTVPLAADRYLRALPTLAGTQVLTWAADLLQLPDPAALTALADGVPPGADGLVFLPYLSPAGERVPFVDATARGGFAGLAFHHDRPRLARAVLEGLTYVIRDCVEAARLAPARLRLCGGGANSPQWAQLIADVLGVPVTRSADRQVGARGAFLTGLVATGAAPDLAAAAAAHVRTRDEFAPDPVRHRAYDARFEDFRAVRDDAARSWPRLARARGPAA